MTQADAPLAAALEQYNQQTKAVFTIPGHHRGAGASAWWADHKACGTFQFDVTEAPRTDDLHAPEGAICQAQNLAAEACGADQAFFLVNGTTCGIEALMLATAGPGQTVLLPRNAHKSALMGLILTGRRASLYYAGAVRSRMCGRNFACCRETTACALYIARSGAADTSNL